MFQLTRGEQRAAIFIVVILVVAAFTQHFLEMRSQPPRARAPSAKEATPARSISTSTPSPTIPPETESDADDSR